MDVRALKDIRVIRSAVEEDLEDVQEIDQLSFPTPWTPHQFKIALKGVFVVYDRGKIMGFLIACFGNLENKAEILRIAVSPDHRGQGIAKELMETSIEIFLKKNIEEVVLDVSSANIGAVKLYEKFGFKIAQIATVMDDQDFHIFYVMKMKLHRPQEVKYQAPKKHYTPEDYYDLQIAA